MREKLRQVVLSGAEKAYEKGLLNSNTMPEMDIEIPRQNAHGDYATNFAMVSASIQKMAPRKIAEALVSCIDHAGFIEKVEIAGPGFINFFLSDTAWHPVLERIFSEDTDYGRSDIGGGTRVQVEFVSANPTGPLHIGHGRGAAVGDSVSRILSFAGYDAEREYYINDAGKQIETLGRSVWLRLLEISGEPVDFPKECYQGEYIKEIASRILEQKGNSFVETSEPEALKFCSDYAADRILTQIKEDLEAFGVEFDGWFSEQSLYDAGKVKSTIEAFRKSGIVYEKDGALWFNTQRFGDEKDRVVVRSNKETTYFASDIAYHMDKFERGFDRLIDVWGADHHGYINRINASIEASDKKSERFDVILVQLVTLLRGGEPCAMSTRAGEFVTLRNIVDEVGRDAARFLFLSRSFDSNLDFDLEVAKQKNSDNPVYYVQYVHARISSILAKACENGVVPKEKLNWNDGGPDCLDRLGKPEEIELLKIMSRFGENVEKSAETLHPHVIYTYLMTLASAFHSYYNKHKVITDDRELSAARLFLVGAVKKVIRNGLTLLGVSAPERM